MKDSAFLLFSLILFQIISFFFTFTRACFSRSAFFLICLILFLNIFFDIFKYIFSALERFVLCPCMLLIYINLFLNWFRLFSFILSLSFNKLISLLMFSISSFWFMFGIFILCTEKKKFLYWGGKIFFI